MVRVKIMSYIAHHGIPGTHNQASTRPGSYPDVPIVILTPQSVSKNYAAAVEPMRSTRCLGFWQHACSGRHLLREPSISQQQICQRLRPCEGQCQVRHRQPCTSSSRTRAGKRPRLPAVPCPSARMPKPAGTRPLCTVHWDGACVFLPTATPKAVS